MGDGSTLRETYEAIERNTGHRPSELDGPEMPDGGLRAWNWFVDLNGARQFGMAANPISFAEMAAYFAFRGERPEQWEVGVLRRLDQVALNSFVKKD